MGLKIKLKTNLTADIAEILADRSSKAENIVANKVKDDTASEYTPFLNGKLDQRTRVVGNTIIYPGPHSHYLWAGISMVDPETKSAWARKGVTKVYTGKPLKYTGSDKQYDNGGHKLAGPHWVERSKAQNIKKWELAAQKAIDGHGR